MPTARQIEANRRNAQRSTGPRTADGKDRAKYNALRHGLAANTLLPHEDLAEYHQMRASLIEAWQPANSQELLEVDNITMGWWCMQRADRFEKNMFDLQVRTMKRLHDKAVAPHPDDDEGIVASFCNRENDKSYELLFRYDRRAASRYYRALDRLMKLQSHRARMQREQIKALQAELASFGDASAAPDKNAISAPAAPVNGSEAAAETPESRPVERDHLPQSPSMPILAAEPRPWESNSPDREQARFR